VTDQHVVYEVVDRTAWIRIDRPERRNAMAVQTTEELIAAFIRAG
jgi:enoyl-CoA hydratase